MPPDRFDLPGEGLAAARVCLAQRLPAGDPAELRAAAYRSGAFAAEIRRSTGLLLATVETGLWHGPAHRAFTDQLHSRAPALAATADRCDSYAAALTCYAGALDEMAAPLGALHRQLQQEVEACTARSDPAAGLLALARTFQARYHQWVDALERCKRALLHAADHDPTRDLHGWHAFGHQLSSVTATTVGTFERAVLHPSLANVSACLGELNAGLSVLGVGLLFVYPPAGAACLAAATVLAVAQLTVDSVRRAHGEQISNASLGFELAAAIPLGGGALRSLKVADDVVHLVPGGGLAAHEAAGGHTLARHVGRPESYLRYRLATEPHITAASTFYNREVAEGAIASLMGAKRKALDQWRRTTQNVLILNGRNPEPVGVVIPRGVDQPQAAFGIKIILKRNQEMEGDFLLFTAMVIE